MRDQIHIRLPAAGTEGVTWVLRSGTGEASEFQRGDLTQAAAAAAHRQIIVWVPAADVVLTRVTAPGGQRRRLAAAIPYLLEDQLAANVEELHFAVGVRPGGDNIPVALVSRAAMDEWLARLRGAGIEPDALIPEILAVPYEAGTWTLLPQGQQALLRTDFQAGVAFDLDNLSFMLRSTLNESGVSRPARLRVMLTEGANAELVPEGSDLGIECAVEHLPEPVLSLFARGYDERAAINLLQGAYSRREQWDKLWRPWRPAAAMLAIWLVVQLGVTLVEYRQLSREQQALSAEIDRIYLQAFPESKRVVNARVQMERSLVDLRKATAGGNSFFKMLSKVAQSLSETPGMELRHIGYKEGDMEIALVIGDLQQLEQLKQRISDQNRFVVEILSASARDNRVDARLHVKGTGA